MDFINYTIQYIKRIIPIEVLDLALTDPRFNVIHDSIDAKIEREILRPTVLLDMNLIAGLHMELPISGMLHHNEIDGITVLKIPDNVLRGRKIVTALSLTTVGPDRVTASDTTMAYATVMTDNHSWISADSTANLEVISDNEILVYDNIQSIMHLSIRFVVEYSNRFNEINPRSYPILADIATIATKAWIRTKLRVKLNQGHIYHGHQLSIMDDIVSEYADMDKEYLDKIRGQLKKVLFINDQQAMDRYVKNLLPNIY